MNNNAMDGTEWCPNCKKSVEEVNTGSSGWYRCEFDHCPVSITNEVILTQNTETDHE